LQEGCKLTQRQHHGLDECLIGKPQQAGNFRRGFVHPAGQWSGLTGGQFIDPGLCCASAPRDAADSEAAPAQPEIEHHRHPLAVQGGELG